MIHICGDIYNSVFFSIGKCLLLSFWGFGVMITKIQEVFTSEQVCQHLESMPAHILNISKNLGLLKQLPMNV